MKRWKLSFSFQSSPRLAFHGRKVRFLQEDFLS
nr:MAG TPA: hypothetical protein [Caudoviricetes sp.]